MSAEFFVRRHLADKAMINKAAQSLLGICVGLIADGELNDAEIRFLELWLADNEAITDDYPAKLLRMRIKSVLSDGHITQEERAHLHSTLAELIGGTLQESGSPSGGSTSLPVAHDPEIIFAGKRFCLTGNFAFGSRSKCTQVIEAHGGEVADSVTRALDYLVIGSMASDEWAHSSYGRKVETAVKHQEKGMPLLIISEEQWAEALDSLI